MLDQIVIFIENLLATYGIEIKENNLLALILLAIGLTIVFQIILMVLLWIAKFAVGKTDTTLDDDILKAVSSYLPYIAFFTSLYISLVIVYPNANIGAFSELQLYLVFMLATISFIITGVIDVFLVWYGVSIQPPKRKQLNKKQIFPFVRTIITVLVFVVFGIFILQILGFDTTALITGLGVGGLAIALALQDTLSNFFAGIHILIDKPFKEGDYIVLESGQEGNVDRIGWRTTKILTLSKDEIIVPNSKLSSSIVKNHSTPQEETGVSYEIGVSYDSNVDKVIDTIKLSIKNVGNRDVNVVKDSEWARLEKYGDFALIFKFGCFVHGYHNKFNTLAEINKEIFNQFKKNKIEIPFPVMVIKKYGKNQ